MLKEALKDGTISNYHILAPKGKSLAFTNTMAGNTSWNELQTQIRSVSSAGNFKSGLKYSEVGK